jgi:hypothetical protein
MPLLVTCSACKNSFRAPDDAKGKEAPCPACGKPVKVEGPTVSPFDVFISYSSKDKTIADAAVAVLESRGLRCWVAPRDIVPGKEWSESIIEGLNQCRMMVLVFSANSNSSQQVVREVERAVNRNLPIVPFRIENLMPSKAMEYFISHQHWLDAYQPPLDDHLEKLASTCQSLLAGRGDQPAEKPKGLKGLVQAATRTLLARDNRVRVMVGLVAAVIVIGLIILGAVYMLKDPKAPDDVVKAKADAEALVEDVKKALAGKGFDEPLRDLDALLRTGQGSFNEKKFDAALAGFKDVAQKVDELRGQSKVKTAREAFEAEVARFPAGLTSKSTDAKWQQLRAAAQKQTESKRYEEAVAGYAAATKEFRETITPQICYLGFWCGYAPRTIYSWREFEEVRTQVQANSNPKFPVRVDPPPFPTMDTYQRCRDVLRQECQPQLQLDEKLVKDILETTQKGDLWAVAGKAFGAEIRKKGGDLAGYYSRIGWDLAIIEGCMNHHVRIGNEVPFYYRYLWIRHEDLMEVCHRLLQVAYQAGLPESALVQLERLPGELADANSELDLGGFSRTGFVEYRKSLALVRQLISPFVGSAESAAEFLRMPAGTRPNLTAEQQETVKALRKLECLVFLRRDDAGATRCWLYFRKPDHYAAALDQALGLPVDRITMQSAKVNDEIMASLSRFPQLRQLELYNPTITDKGFASLQQLTHLQTLSLDNSRQLNDESLKFLGSLKGLRRLCLKGAKIGDAGLHHLKDLVEIEELYLESTKITVKGLEHLRGMTRLRVLQTPLSTKEEQAFKDSMPGFPKRKQPG